MASFSAMLDKAIVNAKFRSLSAFARAAGTSATTVSKCLRDEGTPPLAQLGRWAEVLGLSGTAQQEFIAAGQAAKALSQSRAAPHIQQLVQESNERGRRIDKYETFFFGPRKTNLVSSDPQDDGLDIAELRKRLVITRNANRVLKERLKSLGVDEY